MAETGGFLITGQKTELEKYHEFDKKGGISNQYITSNDSIIYSDTDSLYFKTYATNYDDAVAIADEIAALINASFPAFVMKFFNAPEKNSTFIKAAREVVGSAALFLPVKKKYTIAVVNLDGKKVSKLKAMGSEIKKADTPKVIQQFLSELMKKVLNLESYDELEAFVNSHRKSVVQKAEDLIPLGTAKQINNLDTKYAEWKVVEKQNGGKLSVPGHVRAAINYNELATAFEGNNAKLLTSGDKGIIFYLRPNEFGLKSIAFPSDIVHFPPWVAEHLEIDKSITEEKMIDMKLEGIFTALGYDVPTAQSAFVRTTFTF